MNVKSVIVAAAVGGLALGGATAATAMTHSSPRKFDCASIAQREINIVLGQVIVDRRELASSNAQEQSEALVSLRALQQQLRRSTVVEAINECLASEAAGHNS